MILPKPNLDPDQPRDGKHAAANDQKFAAGEAEYLADPQKVEQTARVMSDTPGGMPVPVTVVVGLTAALQTLATEINGAGPMAARLDTAAIPSASSTKVEIALLAAGQLAGKHLLFSLLQEVGRAVQEGRELSTIGLRTLGAWCLTRLFAKREPSPKAVARLRGALLHHGQQAWSQKAQARAVNSALKGLNAALRANPQAARRYGFQVSEICIAQNNSPIQVFNQAFRRRTEALNEYATTDQVAGAGGHDTLSASGLKTAGAELLGMALSGHKPATLVALEVITHLTSEISLKLPVQTSDKSPDGALAWINVAEGSYHYTLYGLKEAGARPPQKSDLLYEQTADVVRITLPPFIAEILRSLAAKATTPVNCLQDLLGEVKHHARSAVVGESAYRVTARRLQESLPTLLLQGGTHRWPTALATSSLFLATTGRRAYSACRATQIQAAIDKAYELLDWPRPTAPASDDLIGSRVVPTRDAVRTALNFLCAKSNQTNRNSNTTREIIDCLNRHAEWMAMFLALALALRAWQVYEVRADDILTANQTQFNDKDVHVHAGIGVPVVPALRRAVKGWFNLCNKAITNLRVLGDPASLDLAMSIETNTANQSTPGWLFTIDAVGRLEPVGHSAWTQSLPENIRLIANWSRHFWPLRLMDLGVPQLDIDALMRHQFDELTPCSTFMVRVPTKVIARLGEAMESTIAGLALEVPYGFGSVADV